jgi:hypothetical protein
LFYDRKEYPQIERREELVLAGFMGCHPLGIFFHCYKNGPERSSSFYTFDPSVLHWRVSSPSGSASKRQTIS